MSAERHCCPDCGASHPRRKAAKAKPRGAHMESTDLTPARCPDCRAPILAGRVQGVDTQLVPRPINHLGAITYLATARPIVIRRDSRGRNHDPIKRWPPAEGTCWHVTHDCERPVPHELGDAGIDRTRRATHATDDDNPPY